MKRLFNLLFILTIFGCKAQKPILFEGLHNSYKIKILDSNKVLFSYKVDSSVDFKFNCTVVKLNDSLLQFNNSNKTKDTLIYSNYSNKKVTKPRITFTAINRYGDKFIELIDYEIINISENNKKKILLFKYNYRNYAYIIDSRYRNIDVYIDVNNSFLINLWRIRNNQMIPIVDGELDLEKSLIKR